MPRINTATDSFKVLHQQLVTHPQPEETQNLTPADVETLHARLKAHAARWRWLPEPFTGASAVALLVFALTLWRFPEPGTYMAAAGFGAFSFVGALIFHHLMDVSLFHKHFWLTHALTPLRDNYNQCEQALNFVKIVPACAAYQQATLAQGREFLEVDLEAMKELSRQAEVARVVRQREDACRLLHEVPTHGAAGTC